MIKRLVKGIAVVTLLGLPGIGSADVDDAFKCLAGLTQTETTSLKCLGSCKRKGALQSSFDLPACNSACEARFNASVSVLQTASYCDAVYKFDCRQVGINADCSIFAAFDGTTARVVGMVTIQFPGSPGDPRVCYTCGSRE